MTSDMRVILDTNITKGSLLQSASLKTTCNICRSIVCDSAVTFERFNSLLEEDRRRHLLKEANIYDLEV